MEIQVNAPLTNTSLACHRHRKHYCTQLKFQKLKDMNTWYCVLIDQVCLYSFVGGGGTHSVFSKLCLFLPLTDTLKSLAISGHCQLVVLPSCRCTDSSSPSRIGTDSLLSEASEKEPKSRLSLELLRWWRRRRKKLRLADPDPLRDPLSSSESPRLQLSEWLRLSTISSSSLRTVINTFSPSLSHNGWRSHAHKIKPKV